MKILKQNEIFPRGKYNFRSIVEYSRGMGVRFATSNCIAVFSEYELSPKLIIDKAKERLV